ncbi:MarR family transcriptional regulator [Escherichia coli]|nr:MarR family transcriptional regulator [Escherichia coli]EFC6241883.1 MarR family transcriptional regulator [Escherichia coli]
MHCFENGASKRDTGAFRGGQNHKIFAEGEIMKLTPAARRLMTVLNDGPHSLDELAAIAGISRSTVKRAIKELEDKGLIYIERTQENNRNNRNVYILINE